MKKARVGGHMSVNELVRMMSAEKLLVFISISLILIKKTNLSSEFSDMNCVNCADTEVN